MSIEEAELLITWQKQLLAGKTKPYNNSLAGRGYSGDKCCPPEAIVRDAKEYTGIINAINSKLVDHFNLEVDE